ncbi:MAG: phosphoglycerate kinase [Omnitrophica bacterium GWA2_52_8]|nr:MAG: phosphoglycerate kinase [Omnitrophica bacterium GWA2_52_8]
MNKKTLEDVSVAGRRVIIRVDYNVPLNEAKQITDDSRIVKSLKTVQYCLDHGASVILMSHLGRPDGAKDLAYSLRPVAERLSKLLAKPVELMPDCVGTEVSQRANALKPGQVLLLENLRFHIEEKKNDPAFAKQLAGLADIYVNDAFGSAHRAHASTVGITQYLESVAGFLVKKEIEYFEKALSNPERPFVTILGGAKVSDKIKLITNLLKTADQILIGGAMAYTFYKILGIAIGNSKFEPEGVPAAQEALKKSKESGVPIILPVDRVIAQKLEKGAATRVVDGDIPDNWSGFDIGPKTLQQFKAILSKAKTVIWNGPVGVFEYPPFDAGTRALAEHLAGLNATTIIGGGDTAAAIRQFGLEDKMSHVSTGGGASLEYLEGTPLPGITALREKQIQKK